MRWEQFIPSKLQNTKVIRQMITDRRYQTVAYAVFGLIFNLLYAFYNGAFGIRNHSIWFGASCVYYLVLAAMRFLVVTGNQTTNVKKEYTVMRFIGVCFWTRHCDDDRK